jgi:hypothetical protein
VKLMQSKASTVADYLAALPADRRLIIERLREVILSHLDKSFAEAMSYGMIGYGVPHSVYPAGYHCDAKQPVPYAAIASQKQGISLYLIGLCTGAEAEADAQWFREAWLKTGKKLDMGKSCVRFKSLDQVPLEVVGQAIARIPCALFLARYRASIAK